MRRKIRIVVALILILSLFAGCEQTVIQPDGLTAYRRALDALNGSDFTVKVYQFETQDPKRSTAQTRIYNDYATNSATFRAEQAVHYGDNSFMLDTVVSGDTVYLQINGGLFTAVANSDVIPPLTLPTPSEHSIYTVKRQNGYQVIGLCEEAMTATITLTQDGRLLECIYAVREQENIRKTVTRFDYRNCPNVAAPDDSENYISINDLRIPYLLEDACNRLLAAKTVKSNFQYTITCDAGGLTRSEQTILTVNNPGDQLEAQVDTTVQLTNQTAPNTPEIQHQSESFVNGVYTVSDENVSDNPAITEDIMTDYCDNKLVSSLMLPNYIKQASIQETETIHRLDFEASDALAQILFSQAYTTLYADAALTDELQSSYVTKEITGFLEIDRNTGLPINSGLTYRSSNTVADIEHGFSVLITQNYTY